MSGNAQSVHTAMCLVFNSRTSDPSQDLSVIQPINFSLDNPNLENIEEFTTS